MILASLISEEHECVETKTLKAKLRCHLQFVFHYLFWEIFETLHWHHVKMQRIHQVDVQFSLSTFNLALQEKEHLQVQGG
jgi:hypothetical protein